MKWDTMFTHKDLDVWKLGIQCVKDIYQITTKLPNDEKFRLSSQLKRAAVSFPANISVGAARQSHKEYVRFLYISLGSLSEVETLLIISQELDFINGLNEQFRMITELRSKTIKSIKYLKKLEEK